MKIQNIRILFTPSNADDNDGLSRILERTATKNWVAMNEDSSKPGLLPYELRMANEIQEILGRFNSSDKRNA